MQYRTALALVGMMAIAIVPWEDAHGQRAGWGGGFGGGSSFRGGNVVGPYGGGGGGYRSTGTAIGPGGGSRTVGTAGGSYTTGRGTTIDYGAAGRAATGPGGVTAGRGVGGVQVTTPGGQTATKVGTAGGIHGPGGYGVAAGRSIGATSGPYGSGVSAARGGVAVGPGGAVGGGTRVGAGTTVTGRTAAGASHWGAATSPYGAYGSTARGIAVTAPAGHYTTYRTAATLHGQAAYVRTGFRGYNHFNAAWYTTHPSAWRSAAWTAGAYWRWVPYATVAAFCSYPAVPVIYDYGSSVVYVDNRVFYNGEPVATAEDYAAQAAAYAAAGQAAQTSDKEDWQSLGVFAMVQGDEKDANNLFQLAINKEGVIRGNYFNSMTDISLPIYGAVDRRTQRAAWFVGEKRDTVYETGLGNLSQPETSILVHMGNDRTQQRTLVRLEPPTE